MCVYAAISFVRPSMFYDDDGKQRKGVYSPAVAVASVMLGVLAYHGLGASASSLVDPGTIPMPTPVGIALDNVIECYRKRKLFTCY